MTEMNNTMVREIHGANINPKSSLKNWSTQNTRGRKLREQMRYIGRIKVTYIYMYISVSNSMFNFHRRLLPILDPIFFQHPLLKPLRHVFPCRARDKVSGTRRQVK
jgi:hypothetical protein